MKAYSLDLRQKVIDAYNQKEGSQRQLAKRFSVSLSFVQDLLKRYREDQTIEPRAHGGGAPTKLNDEQRGVIRKLVEEENDAILVELCERLEQQSQVRVSRATMGRMLQKLGITRKKKSFYASERHSERVQRLRMEYWHTLGGVKLSDLVFIDEAGVNLAMSRRYARSLKGTRAYGERPGERGKNVTMIGGISLQGFVASLTFQGGTNGIAFQTYITEVLVPNLWEGACVVMDNFSSHKVDGIREAIEAVGARLVYLPPYSPDFNPIENCWSKVKEFLRTQAARTYEALDQAITEAFNSVTTKDLIGWFSHCCYYVEPTVPDCIAPI